MGNLLPIVTLFEEVYQVYQEIQMVGSTFLAGWLDCAGKICEQDRLVSWLDRLMLKDKDRSHRFSTKLLAKVIPTATNLDDN